MVKTLVLLPLLLVATSAFAPPSSRTVSSTRTCRASTCLTAKADEPKGFGKKAPKAAPKEKSAAQIEREKAASAYDNLAASGVPEHNIWVRVKGGGDQDWVPAGTMAVPRTEKVANAVFEQQEALLSGLYRVFPKLKGEELEYGSNLKLYPDEAVKVLEPKEKSDDMIKNWFESLLSPINTSK
ncbi:hypothetical protein JKP88DRAFT_234329 [Tribonema minus]|uniref:Uncharacterized protein n=1 Tax=Tribonema minus TaxID=303371 RepID=A0A836CM14_9STRA|nr:hypothetical protein JKP88DRAFT_234329 [Tribonema minus]